MFADQWSHILSATVTPVVIISAAALLCLALYNRLAAIVARLRLVQRERLDLQEQWESSDSSHETSRASARLTCLSESLEAQTERMHRRARQIRAALLCLLMAIAVLLLAALFNGLTIIWPSVLYAAAVIFVFGMLLMLAGICCAAAEMQSALDPAELEVLIVDELLGKTPAAISSSFTSIA